VAEAGDPNVPLVAALGAGVNALEISLSTLLDASFCSDYGAIIYRDQLYWQCLDPGTAGQVLTTQGPGAPPVWGPGGGVATPAFTAFSITGQTTPLEVGATIAAGSKTFTWSTSNSAQVKPNSISIVDTTASATLASGLANNGTDAITITAITNNVPATQVWTINGLNTSNGNFNRTYTVSWLWRVYAGDNASVTLTANQIKALTAFSSLQAGFAGTYTITPTSDFSYFSYPDSLGSVASFVDANTGFPISMADVTDNAAYSHVANGWSYALVSVTNANSVATNYRVYRTANSFSGTLAMKVT
jgi:hypothetical protein